MSTKGMVEGEEIHLQYLRGARSEGTKYEMFELYTVKWLNLFCVCFNN